MRGFSKKPFVRNVATVATGTIAAQAMAVAFSPIITRLYGPDAFGALGVFAALTAVIVPAVSLTYQTAIVLPADDGDAKGLVALSAIIAAAISAALALILLVFRRPIVAALQLQAIEPLVWLAPAVIFFTGCSNILGQWMIRKKQFKTRAGIDVANVLTLNSIKTGAGFFWPTSVVLVGIAAMGSLLNAVMMTVGSAGTLLSRPVRISNVRLPSRRRLADLAREYKDFPLFRAPQVFINAASVGMPVLLLASLFGPAPAGFYALSRRVLKLPGQVIGKAIGDVFYPRIAEAGRRGENLQRLIVRATLGLAAVGILPYGLIVAFGPWLFGVVFGSEWVRAGEYARWVALWLFFAFANKPSTTAIPVLNIQGFYLIFEIAVILLRVLALLVGLMVFHDDLAAVSLYSSAGVVLNVVLILYVVANSRKLPARGRETTNNLE